VSFAVAPGSRLLVLMAALAMCSSLFACACRRQPDPPKAAAPLPIPAPSVIPAASPDGAVAKPRPHAGLQPARPPGLPSAATWLGGPDGGVFVLLEPPGTLGKIQGKVFHLDGSLWFSGSFVPEPRGTVVDVSRTADWLGWDGERLHLTGNRALRAVGRKR
jgi:hypothetical protein